MADANPNPADGYERFINQLKNLATGKPPDAVAVAGNGFVELNQQGEQGGMQYVPIETAGERFVRNSKKVMNPLLMIYMFSSTLFMGYVTGNLLTRIPFFEGNKGGNIILALCFFIVLLIVRVITGMRHIDKPISAENFAIRIILRVVIVVGVYHVVTELVKRRVSAVDTSQSLAPASSHDDGLASDLVNLLAGVYGFCLSDIALGFYGGLETSLAETSIVIFIGFAFTFSGNKFVLGVMIFTVLTSCIIYIYQTAQSSIVPTTSDLRTRVVQLEGRFGDLENQVQALV